MEIAILILNSILLGIKHILIGYDHVLFIVSLILIWVSWKRTLRIITVFTIGHSIALFLAGFNIVHIPASIVEPIIAISIVYVLLFGVFLKKSDSNINIVFLFGVFHGLGFASVFQDISFGTPVSWGILCLLLISFNIGVEIGQVIIITLVAPLLIFLKKYTILYMYCTYVFASIVMILASYWFIVRSFI